MPVSTAMLGMNARNYLYIRKFNRRSQKLVADDKLLTKKRLIKKDVPTNKILAVFRSLQDVRAFDWTSLPADFAVKPARGYGVSGMVIKELLVKIIILISTSWNELFSVP